MYALVELLRQGKLSLDAVAALDPVEIAAPADFWQKTKDFLLPAERILPDLLLDVVEQSPRTAAESEEQANDYQRFLRELPVARVPFPYMWMEYKQPEASRELARYATALTIDTPDGKAIDVSRSLHKWIRRYRHAAYPGGTKVASMEAGNFIEDRIGYAMGALFRAHSFTIWESAALLRETGQPTEPEFAFIFCDDRGEIIPKLAFSMTRHAIVNRITPRFYPFLFATCLMHTRGIATDEEVIGASTPRNAQSVHEKEPFVVFKTITIRPTIASEVAEKKEEGEQEQAFHVVRGHFKDYRANGLFGKNKGIYWFSAHEAGEPEMGFIVADYKVVL